MNIKKLMYIVLLNVYSLGYTAFVNAAVQSSTYTTQAASITLRAPSDNNIFISVGFATGHFYDPACAWHMVDYMTIGGAAGSGQSNKKKEIVALMLSSIQSNIDVSVTRRFHPGTCFPWITDLVLK